jgi:hypothetical protein
LDYSVVVIQRIAGQAVGQGDRHVTIARYYDDGLANLGLSIFLAGPTSRGVRTAWRIEAMRTPFDGTWIVPEFRDEPFDVAAPRRFARDASPVPGMKSVSYNILEWETTGIERATVVLFWMPFAISQADDPASLPGFTTRAEVSREIVRAPERIVLGMTADAFSGSHIRYHAHRDGVRTHDTLAATVTAAIALARSRHAATDEERVL